MFWIGMPPGRQFPRGCENIGWTGAEFPDRSEKPVREAGGRKAPHESTERCVGQFHSPNVPDAPGPFPGFLMFGRHMGGLGGKTPWDAAAGMNCDGFELAFVINFHQSFTGSDAHLFMDQDKWDGV